MIPGEPGEPRSRALPAHGPEPRHPLRNGRARPIGLIEVIPAVLRLLRIDSYVDVLVLFADALESALADHELAVQLVLADLEVMMALG